MFIYFFYYLLNFKAKLQDKAVIEYLYLIYWSTCFLSDTKKEMRS